MTIKILIQDTHNYLIIKWYSYAWRSFSLLVAKQWDKSGFCFKFIKKTCTFYTAIGVHQGRIQGGRTRRAPPLKLGKNMIFWRKIVIFHTKYPKIFRVSLRSAQFFLSAPPLAWNPGSAPIHVYKIYWLNKGVRTNFCVIRTPVI